MIVAAYNRPQSIMATLYCLLIQSLPDFEIIVVHDGPGPQVRAAVCGIPDARIVYMETPARNNDWGNSSKEFGSQLARGKFIGHSNDDNYYTPIYLESMVNAMVTTGAEFAYSNMVHSHHRYAAFETSPSAGWIDGGGWLCKAEVVRSTPWPEPRSDAYADGRYVEALVARCKGVVKVPGFLFVHN
jgi:hypothetical protein